MSTSLQLPLRQYRAMALVNPAQHLLQPIELEVPAPEPGQLLLAVCACGVCRTDLHILDGELAVHRFPCVPGHEIVARVVAQGGGCHRFAMGQRVGVPWLNSTCGTCRYCRSGRENLCVGARFTGLDVDGGYAEYAVAQEEYCFALPERFNDTDVAPLLCAGLIGWRALRMAGDADTIGIYGFGAAGHLVAQIALAQGRHVFAFTRSGDISAQALARELGVQWAGASDEAPPAAIDAAILFAPAGELVPHALLHVSPGGSVVCAGIHMSDIPTFGYRLLWGERVLRSVANLTRRDGEEFFSWVEQHPLQVSTTVFALKDANEALRQLRDGNVVGAAVLQCTK